MSSLLSQWAAHPPTFYVAAIFGILLTGVFKGGFGGGPGGIAVALMSMFIAPADAAGIVLPILCMMDILGMLAYRNNWSREHMKVPTGPQVPFASTDIVMKSVPRWNVPKRYCAGIRLGPTAPVTASTRCTSPVLHATYSLPFA